MRRGYTLLEVILALALATVILGLVGMAIQVQLRVADVSRAQVEEAQLARGLLQHMAEDVRDAIPLVPGKEGTTSAATTTTPASAADDDDTDTAPAPLSGGLFGTAQQLQVEVSRPPRPDRQPAAPAGDDTQTARLSDVRNVTYSLGDPGTSSAGEQSGAGSGQVGLYRRELDRAELAYALQQGQTDLVNQAAELLAPEVQDLQFLYYDGSTTYEEWDASQQGKLPSAVKISLSLRRGPPKSATAAETAEDRPPAVYDILVELPNAQVKVNASGTNGTSGGSSSKTDSSSSKAGSSSSPSQPTEIKPITPIGGGTP